MPRKAPTWQERLRSQATELGITDPAVVRQLERLVEAESGGDPLVIAAANMPASVVQKLRAAGYRVVEYSGPQWGEGISVGLFQINVLAPPAASARELDRIGRQVYGDRWRPKADPSDWESIIQRVALLSEPDYNVQVAMAHIGSQLRAGRSLAEALQPWEAAGKVLSEGGAGSEAVGQAPDQGSLDSLLEGVFGVEGWIDYLKKLGFSEAEAKALLRRSWIAQNVGVSTDPTEMLQAGLGWLANLSELRQRGLVASAQAQADATKLLTSLLGRAAPGGQIPGMEPGGTIDWFSRLAGLPPMQRPQTRTVDLGPLFETAAALRPEADPYFAALAAAASRLGTDVQGLWERALREMDEWDMDETVPSDLKEALNDWRLRAIEGAQSPMDAFARLGYAM